MFVNKIGQQHLEIGMNCQDYGFEGNGFDGNNLKIVCDGCSEGLHTEVGAKTFCHLISNGYSIYEAFTKLVEMFGQSNLSIKNFLCFTVLCVFDSYGFFHTMNCGDGYIITEDIEGNITFEELTDGEFPKYYSYNFCDPNTLKYYKDGVAFDCRKYCKDRYKNVGVASDGLRFILSANEDLKSEFIELLRQKNAVKIKRFINRNQKLFKDDITIVF